MSNDNEFPRRVEYNPDTRTYREITQEEIEGKAEVLWAEYDEIQAGQKRLVAQEENVLEKIGLLQSYCPHTSQVKKELEDKDYPPVIMCMICHKPFSIAPEPPSANTGEDRDDDLPF